MNFQSTPYQVFPKPITPPPVLDQGAFCVTFDGKWIPYLLGAISQLAIDRTWISDNERATGEARNLLSIFAGAIKCPTPGLSGIEAEDNMSCCLRIQDGKLQCFSCGEWVTIPGGDLRALSAGSGQPAQGTQQPGPGGCEQLIGRVIYGGRWLLPIPVSTGDQISVTNALGATSGYIHDGLTYRCGDGLLFLAGGCVTGTETFDAGNPMPLVPRDALIAFDGTNYYDCSAAANGMSANFTIPTGISNANLVLLINNQDVGGAGDLTFDIRVCKGEAAPIFITYNFGTGPAGVNENEVFTINSTCCGGGGAGDENINIQFSEDCYLECLSTTSFTCAWAGSQIWLEGFLPLGTPVQQHNDPCGVRNPTEWSSATKIRGWVASEGSANVPWSGQFKLHR